MSAAVVHLRAAAASATVDLLGGRVVSWVPAHATEMLFASAASGAGPPRGGIPVVFPQFAELGDLPLHGVAHAMRWRPRRVASNRALLEVHDDAASRRHWPRSFGLTLAVVLAARELRLTLTVENRDREPITFAAAFHPYLRVGDIAAVTLHGLAGAEYEERIAPGRRHRAGDEPLRFEQPIDRAYPNVQRQLRLVDRSLMRSVVIRKRGFADFVVWNPGAEHRSSTPFLRHGEHRHMLCVEAAQMIQPVVLPPGACWRARQEFALGEARSESDPA